MEKCPIFNEGTLLNEKSSARGISHHRDAHVRYPYRYCPTHPSLSMKS